ncbi:MAG: DUF2779 domain-containing protein [Crocinitomicaceae bacterium]|nr:DUF2779 domain-containing protein [Crocinitomicaceae bacterium]
MKKRFLSKSDYKVARTCPTKLYYRKLKFPTTMEGNEFMEMLAEGGYMVGKLATLLYPGGIDLSNEGSPEKSALKTAELIRSNENIIIYEASALFEDFLIRIDILEKKGNVINLIEVKAKSYDGSLQDPMAGLGDYFEDVVYQHFVLKNAFPEFEVKPFLFMPDKSKTTNLEGLNGMFEIVKKPGSAESKFVSYDVQFNGNVADLLQDDLMTLVDVSAASKNALSGIEEIARFFSRSINPTLLKVEPDINSGCSKCEFHSPDPKTDGFRACWGKLADAPPDLLSMYRMGNVNSHHEGIIDSLIREGKVRLKDFPSEILIAENRKNKKPYYNNRPLMHLTYKEEWISDELKTNLRCLKDTIHFIDFETSRMALPYHKDMRPYENVAFQWSCHTLNKRTGELTHQEWINTAESFPNFEFALSLMQATNDGGEIMIWSHHENTVLRDIHSQMEKYGFHNDALKKWLEYVVKFDDADTTEMTDMCRWAELGYFHPYTNGRTSIKVTLPAVLSSFTNQKIQTLLENFEPGINLFKKENNIVVSPYKLLPAASEIDQYEVAEGTAAMRAYQDMLYGFAKNDPAKKESIKQALLKYCKLDTLAMVVIYEHWMSL